MQEQNRNKTGEKGRSMQIIWINEGVAKPAHGRATAQWTRTIRILLLSLGDNWSMGGYRAAISGERVTRVVGCISVCWAKMTFLQPRPTSDQKRSSAFGWMPAERAAWPMTGWRRCEAFGRRETMAFILPYGRGSLLNQSLQRCTFE